MVHVLSQQAEELDKLLEAIRPLLVQYVHENTLETTPVWTAMEPEDLKAQLTLELPEKGVGMDGIFVSVRNALKYSIRTGNPRFFDKLYCGSDPIGMISELLTTALNCNIHIYRASPVFTLMELHAIEEIGKLFGFPEADGITCPGGTYVNMLAMLTARNTKFPHTKMEGVSREDRLVVLTSSESHYSIAKSANALGLGMDNVVNVPTNEHGEMIPEELERILEELVREGRRPFFINATSGTTVKGGFDPLEDIARISKKYNLWMHIDGCWGGSVIFSRKHRHLMAGSDKADSIAWNPHKMLGVPLQMSFLIMRNKGLLQQSNALGAGYLFQGSDYDLGDKTLQCGRKPDSFKMYLIWRYLGSEGFERRIDLAFENTARFVEMIKQRSDEFELVVPPRGVNTCFWYIPKDRAEELKGDRELLTNLTSAACQRVNAHGKVMLDYSPNTRGSKFFRMVINSPLVRESDLAMVLDQISLHAGEVIKEGGL